MDFDGHSICLIDVQGSDGVLEAAEHALDDVALAIDLAVVFDLDLAVGLRRDDRRGALLDQPLAQGVAVVTFVSAR